VPPLRTRPLRDWLFAFIALSTVGCTPLAERFSERNKLLGCWYGHGEQDRRGVDVHWVLKRDRTGDFAIRFHELRGETLVDEHAEHGRWSYSTGLYTVVTTSLEDPGHAPRNVFFSDIYEVSDLDARPLVYVQLQNRHRHASQPVPCDFELPPGASNPAH
jgi:hypothetical protein